MNAVDTNVLMSIAACVENGIQTLYSEDFDSSTTRLTGVKIINPF